MALECTVECVCGIPLLPIANAVIGTTVTLDFYCAIPYLFGLGIIVDDAICGNQNTHRIYNNGKSPNHYEVRKKQPRWGCLFLILAGHGPPLASFFPLFVLERAHTIGKVLIYLPTILILTLAASQLFAFIFQPVFAVGFMRPGGKECRSQKQLYSIAGGSLHFIAAGILMHLGIIAGRASFCLWLCWWFFNVCVGMTLSIAFRNGTLLNLWTEQLWKAAEVDITGKKTC